MSMRRAFFVKSSKQIIKQLSDSVFVNQGLSKFYQPRPSVPRLQVVPIFAQGEYSERNASASRNNGDHSLSLRKNGDYS